jgi:hypothetical protein
VISLAGRGLEAEVLIVQFEGLNNVLTVPAEVGKTTVKVSAVFAVLVLIVSHVV